MVDLDPSPHIVDAELVADLLGCVSVHLTIAELDGPFGGGDGGNVQSGERINIRFFFVLECKEYALRLSIDMCIDMCVDMCVDMYVGACLRTTLREYWRPT